MGSSAPPRMMQTTFLWALLTVAFFGLQVSNAFTCYECQHVRPDGYDYDADCAQYDYSNMNRTSGDANDSRIICFTRMYDNGDVMRGNVFAAGNIEDGHCHYEDWYGLTDCYCIGD